MAENALRDLWLSGQMNQASTAALLTQVQANLAPVAPDLAAQAGRLAEEVSQHKQLTQRHDNTFGRMFESALGKALVDQPAPTMLAAADAVNRYLLQHMLTDQKHYTSDHNIQSLAEALKKDPRPWHAEVPQLQAYLQQPSAQTLSALLSPPTQNGYEMVMSYWVAAKVSSDVIGPWMNAANHNYSHAIKPSRSSEDTVTSSKGTMHVARAGLEAERILQGLEAETFKAAGLLPEGDPTKAELRALRNDLVNRTVDVERAMGYVKHSDGTLHADRQELVDSISAAADRVASSRPDLAQALRDLLPALTSAPEGGSVDDIVLEVAHKASSSKDDEVGGEPVKTAHYGTALLHQPKPEVPDDWQAQINVPSRTGVNVQAPKAFERNALENNQNTVNGLSGTTNMLAFLLNHMERAGALKTADGQSLNHGDAFAGNLAFLVMDGGHSIPEAMATAASIAADPREVPPEDFKHLPQEQFKAARSAVQAEVQANRQAVLDTHVTSYLSLGDVLGGGATGTRLADAVQAAFDVTRARFDEFHAARA
jgi:hypothetical protein